MLKTKGLSVLLAIMIILSAATFTSSAQNPPVVHGTGALVMTPEEIEAFLESASEIVDVKLNSLAAERIEEDTTLTAEEIPDVVAIGEEIVTEEDAATETSMFQAFAGSSASPLTLPTSVDNSVNETFPPIGDQGSSSSCTSWSMIYYQMTNNTALVRGWKKMSRIP
jgi:hypothetical protein